MLIFDTVKSAGAFATKTQLTWATYALFVCQYSASITSNVQPVGELQFNSQKRDTQEMQEKA